MPVFHQHFSSRSVECFIAPQDYQKLLQLGQMADAKGSPWGQHEEWGDKRGTKAGEEKNKLKTEKNSQGLKRGSVKIQKSKWGIQRMAKEIMDVCEEVSRTTEVRGIKRWGRESREKQMFYCYSLGKFTGTLNDSQTFKCSCRSSLCSQTMQLKSWSHYGNPETFLFFFADGSDIFHNLRYTNTWEVLIVLADEMMCQ